MSYHENTHCRLCAELKPYSKLADLQTQDDICAKVISRLSRLNCDLDFRDTILPKTICMPCINSLNNAFDFVIAVERAQAVLKESITTHNIKIEIEECEHIDVQPSPIEQFTDKDYTSIPIKSEASRENDNTIEIEIELPKKIEKVNIESIKSEYSSIKSWQDCNWKCRYCETQFPTVSELTSHSMKYHDVCNAYSCTDCNSKKLSLDGFVKHAHGHYKNLKLCCYVCNKKYLCSRDMIKHKTIHKGSEFKCNGCNTYFENNELLKKHTRVFYKRIKRKTSGVGGLNKDDLTCEICKKVFKTKKYLSTHLWQHKNREHICELCGLCFVRKQNLADHMMKHEDKRPFQCKICENSFRSKVYLRNHVSSMHDNKKPFSCDKCGKCFRLKKHLVSHEIIHTDSLPFDCAFCDKKFRFKTRLDIHLRQHTGVKPYSCEFCQRDFTNWSNYNKHMKRKHDKDMSKKRRMPDGSTVPDMGDFEQEGNFLEWKKKILTLDRPRNQTNVLESKGET